MKRKKRTHRVAPESRWRLATGGWIAGAALLLLVAFAYQPTLSNGFIWDDDDYVEQNATLQSAHGLLDIWFKLGAVPQYYPLVHTSFWLESRVWGLQPVGFHLDNMLLHAVSVLLAWRLLLRLQVPGAWLAAAMFAVHPVEVESVAWITERKNVLSCALSLAALWAWLRFDPLDEQQNQPRAGDWRFYVLSLGLFVCALLSKTVTATLPAVILVIEWWKRGRLRRLDVLRLAPFFAIGLSLAALTVWMEKTYVGAQGPDWQLSWIERLLIAGRALWFYASKLIWPHPLVFFYPRWTIDAGAWWQYLFPLGVLAVIAGLWLARGRMGRGPLAAVLIFAGVLAPALGFFDVYPFLYSFVADHFQYHASIAMLALAAAAVALVARGRHRSLAIVAAGVWLVALAVTAREKTTAYHDVVTLYEDTLALNPDAWAAHVNLAYHLQHQGEFDEAVDHFQQALAIHPSYDSIHLRLGAALFLSGKADEGLAEVERGLAGQLSDFERAAGNVHAAVILNFQRRSDAAAAHAQAALAIRSDYAPALLNLGIALEGQGDRTSGIERVRQAVAINPASALAQHKLGAMLLADGRAEESLEPLRAAVRLQPANPMFHQSLAEALVARGELPAAEDQVRTSLALAPSNPSALNLLGSILQQRGDASGAARCFAAAIRLDPTNESARENLQRATGSGVKRSPSAK